jgi:hypothetical protein
VGLNPALREKKMDMKTIRFEVKYSGKYEWEEISEKTVMEKLVDNFDPLTPILCDMLQGKEITIPQETYRIAFPKQ